MNKYGLGLVLALVVAAGGAYWVSTQGDVNDASMMAVTVKEKAGEMAEKAKVKAKELGEKAKVAATNTAAVATDAANKAAEKAKEAVDSAKKTVVAEADTEEAASDAPKNVGKNSEKEFVDGKWEDENGAPTYNIDGDGQVIKQVDWYTYSGWRRYHAECHVCHGPSGKGSTYAPALADTMKDISYEKFLQVVSSGQENVWGRNNSIMPALGDNKNVMCFIDDIYVYLRARAEGAMPAGKLSSGQRAEKPQEARDFESECFG